VTEVPVLVLKREDVWGFSWRNCLLFCWHQLTNDGVLASNREVVALRKQYPYLVTASVALPGLKVPDLHTQLFTLKMTKLTARDVRAAAMVFEGKGVLRIGRNFLAAILLMAWRSELKLKVHGTIDEASAWLAPLVIDATTGGPTADPAIAGRELAEAFRHVRSLCELHAAA
jgi:hypothetical protein